MGFVKDYIIKAQIDLLKSIDGSLNLMALEIKEENVYFAPDQYRAFVIPEKYWFINDHIQINKTNTLSKFFEISRIPGCAVISNDIKICGQETAIKIPANEDVWVNVKYLKAFGKIEDFGKTLLIKADKAKSPVYITDKNEEIYGLVMPVNMERWS